MEIVRTYTCPCSPGKTFSSSSTLSQHRKSKKHLAYDEKSKEQKISETKRDNELYTMELKLKDREEHIEKLIMEKHLLQDKIEKHLENEKNIEHLCTKILNLQTANRRLKSENTNLREMVNNFKKQS